MRAELTMESRVMALPPLALRGIVNVANTTKTIKEGGRRILTPAAMFRVIKSDHLACGCGK